MSASPPLWRLAAGSVNLLVGVVFIPLGCVFLGVGVASALDEHESRGRSHRVEATVLDRSIRRGNFTDTPATRYLIRYGYTAPDGTPRSIDRVVEVEEWERLPPGSRGQVVVMPDGPAEASADPQWEFAIVFSALGLMLGAVGLPVFAIGARDIARQRRAGPSGIPT